MEKGDRVVGMCRCSAVVLLRRRWVDRWSDGCRKVEVGEEGEEAAMRRGCQRRGRDVRG